MTAQQAMRLQRNQTIVRLSKLGHTPKYIASKLCMHVTGIHRILRKNGAGRRASKGSNENV